MHHRFGAYCCEGPALENPQLYSLKLERVVYLSSPRLYVDAVLVDAGRIGVVPFLLIADDGSLRIQERYSALPGQVQAALADRIVKWLHGKNESATLEATTFLSDREIDAAVMQSQENLRPFPGLVPYDWMFTEAERYANVTPYVRGKRIVDCNPGYGYGARTLGALAASVDLRNAEPIAARLWQTNAAPQSYDVAIYLGASDVEQTLQALREEVPSARLAVISMKGPGAAQAFQSAGAEAIKMRRPGCDTLGDLDETLGLFPTEAKRVTPVENAHAAAHSPASVAPRPLRVLFALRPSAEHIFGGDVVQVRETANALRARGHFVEVSTAVRLNTTGFDVVHLSNITVPPETLPQAESARDFPGAVVMMPIFTDHADETAWGMSATIGTFLGAAGDDDLREKLAALEARALVAAGKQPPPARVGMIEGYEGLQRRILDLTDYLIANAHAEIHRLYRYLNCEIPYAVAPSCADPATYGLFARDAFVQRYGLEDFVLIAGRYEARKNQLMLFEAMRELPYPLVCVGGNHEPWTAYAVRSYRPPNATYIGFLPESELAGAFAAARVVAAPSWDEVVSLTSLNAAISEASMVLTRNSYEHEYFRDDAEYCDPGSVSSIRRALQRAWEAHDERKEQRKALAARVIGEYNWQRAAELTEAAYYRVLAHNPRRERRLRGTSTP